MTSSPRRQGAVHRGSWGEAVLTSRMHPAEAKDSRCQYSRWQTPQRAATRAQGSYPNPLLACTRMQWPP
eukprot:scaffold39838_cov70-Phaeocystis_antarctica.AAC.16